MCVLARRSGSTEPIGVGSTPLVRLNATACTDNCDYRTAPESLVSVKIDLSPPPFPIVNLVQPPHERATVQMPNGITLDYEPIHYDGVSYPAPPPAAQTGSCSAFACSQSPIATSITPASVISCATDSATNRCAEARACRSSPPDCLWGSAGFDGMTCLDVFASHAARDQF